MKPFVKILTLCILLGLAAGCAAPAAPAAPEAAKPVEDAAAKPAEPTTGEVKSWLEVNQLGEFSTPEQDWAAIEAAAKKEGKVVVYANSSRIEDQIAIWNKTYPDIVLEGYDTEGIATKMEEEQNAGNVVGDVWFNSDIMSMYGILYPKGMILPFIPSEFAATLPVTKEQPFAIARYGGDAWGYNNEQNPNGCPISNWWQLVDGTYPNNIYFEDPLAEADKIGLFVTTIKHGDEMAVAYKENSGKEWTTDPDYDAATTLNAGWLWVKKFAKSPKLVVMPGGDEILEAMATLGMTDPAGMANNSYSKMRDTMNGELAFTVCTTLKPSVGTSGTSLLGIANNAPHPNAAKLYIRFSLSKEGREPWNVLGDWPAQTDYPAPADAPLFKDANLWPDDGLLMYQIGSQVRDFWTTNLLGN
jgi:iron(III) transport system substrate-binding protein